MRAVQSATPTFTKDGDRRKTWTYPVECVFRLLPRAMPRVLGMLTFFFAAVVSASCGAGDSTPEGFADVAKLPTCGAVDSHKTMPSLKEMYPDKFVACLERSRERRGACFELVLQTTEDDSIVYHFSTAPESDYIELFVDGTSDKYGDWDWEHKVCSMPDVSAERLLDCAQTG